MKSMIVIAVLALTVFHPGCYFPKLDRAGFAESSHESSSGEERNKVQESVQLVPTPV